MLKSMNNRTRHRSTSCVPSVKAEQVKERKQSKPLNPNKVKGKGKGKRSTSVEKDISMKPLDSELDNIIDESHLLPQENLNMKVGSWCKDVSSYASSRPKSRVDYPSADDATSISAASRSRKSDSRGKRVASDDVALMTPMMQVDEFYRIGISMIDVLSSGTVPERRKTVAKGKNLIANVLRQRVEEVRTNSVQVSEGYINSDTLVVLTDITTVPVALMSFEVRPKTMLLQTYWKEANIAIAAIEGDVSRWSTDA